MIIEIIHEIITLLIKLIWSLYIKKMDITKTVVQNNNLEFGLNFSIIFLKNLTCKQYTIKNKKKQGNIYYSINKIVDKIVIFGIISAILNVKSR